MSSSVSNSDLCCDLKIKKGLDLKIKGSPEQSVNGEPVIKKVAILGDDYPMMKPALTVKVGDKVKLGQELFTDRNNPSIRFTSPGAGKVVEINRGERRAFESIVIELSGNSEVTFTKYPENKIDTLSRDKVQKVLLDSGLWTSIRNRPFGYVARPEETAHSIFITSTDTNPHAPEPGLIIQSKLDEYTAGIRAVSRLCEGVTYVARKTGSKLPVLPGNRIGDVQVSGMHPAGNVGTHIHFVDPAGRGKNIWHLNYQDVIAIGHLFLTGKILTERIISVAGPSVKKPSLVKTRLGASTDSIVKGNTNAGENRIVSGSLLSGHTAVGSTGYLGRFHHQVSVLTEGRKRKFLGWLAPGFKMFSVKNIYISALYRSKEVDFNTSTNGSPRAMVPFGAYEKVMPLDIIPTFLLRSLLMNDTTNAEELGVLELDEEDLALCTFVSPGKEDFGQVLRKNLIQIEKEG